MTTSRTPPRRSSGGGGGGSGAVGTGSRWALSLELRDARLQFGDLVLLFLEFLLGACEVLRCGGWRRQRSSGRTGRGRGQHKASYFRAKGSKPLDVPSNNARGNKILPLQYPPGLPCELSLTPLPTPRKRDVISPQPRERNPNNTVAHLWPITATRRGYPQPAANPLEGQNPPLLPSSSIPSSFPAPFFFSPLFLPPHAPLCTHLFDLAADPLHVVVHGPVRHVLSVFGLDVLLQFSHLLAEHVQLTRQTGAGTKEGTGV